MAPPSFQSRWPIQSVPQPQTPMAPRVLLALHAGAAHAASLAWPFSLQATPLLWLGLQDGQPVWWLQLLALALLAWLLSGQRSHSQDDGRGPAWRLAALWAWLFATAWLAGSFWWLFVAMHTYGGLPTAVATLAVLALAGLLALYYAAAAALFVVLAPVNRVGAALVFAALWLLAELARGTWLTGFGWGASGYAQVAGPLAGLAPWIGVYGLCALTAWLAMTLMQSFHEPIRHCERSEAIHDPRLPGLPRRCAPRNDDTSSRSVCGSGSELADRNNLGWCWALRLTPLLLLASLLWAASLADATKSTGRLTLTLLQGNIPQDEKFETGSGVPLALQWYADQLKASRTALVIAPETAIPVLPQQLPNAYWSALQQRFASGQQAALLGLPLGNAEAGYTNSALGFKPAQTQPWRYDKQHLVPFGEFIPPLFKWFTKMMNIPLGDFNRGALRQPPFEWQGQRLATNICYEDLFSEELGLQFIDSAQAPTILVNISNLAWFGSSLAQEQHLQIARLRALEFARPFVLVTNTGTSAIVDHRGQIVARLPRDTRSVLVGEVEGRSGVTPYAWWLARSGLWPLWLLALAVVGLASAGALARRQGTNSRV